jgi:hypothetical protein
MMVLLPLFVLLFLWLLLLLLLLVVAATSGCCTLGRHIERANLLTKMTMSA